MEATAIITMALPKELVQALPSDPLQRQLVVEYGLKEWHIHQALDAYRNEEGKLSLAYCAKMAGVSVREMILMAYAHGISPRVDPEWISTPLSMDEAADL